MNFTGYEEISGKYWAVLKQSARLRKHNFLINIKEAWDLFIKQNKKCALTNLPLSFSSSGRTTDWTSYTASLDRIDSRKDYTIDNIQWVHKDANLMKQQYTNDYFIAICNLVASNKPLKNINIIKIEKGGRFGKTPKVKPSKLQECFNRTHNTIYEK